MTENQAEKLAEQIVWDEEWAETEKCCGGKYIDTEKLEKLISDAITQATAELRAENERLKARGVGLTPAGITIAQLSDELADANKMIESHETALGRVRSKLIAFREENERLTAERDQAKAQVAALTGSIKGLWNRNDVMMNVTAQKELLDAVKNTQATSEAHDAKVRQEAREATIGECIAAIQETRNETEARAKGAVLSLGYKYQVDGMDKAIIKLKAMSEPTEEHWEPHYCDDCKGAGSYDNGQDCDSCDGGGLGPSDKPDDIKAVVKAAKEIVDDDFMVQNKLRKVVNELSPESLKMIEEA